MGWQRQVLATVATQHHHLIPWAGTLPDALIIDDVIWYDDDDAPWYRHTTNWLGEIGGSKIRTSMGNLSGGFWTRQENLTINSTVKKISSSIFITSHWFHNTIKCLLLDKHYSKHWTGSKKDIDSAPNRNLFHETFLDFKGDWLQGNYLIVCFSYPLPSPHCLLLLPSPSLPLPSTSFSPLPALSPVQEDWVVHTGSTVWRWSYFPALL